MPLAHWSTQLEENFLVLEVEPTMNLDNSPTGQFYHCSFGTSRAHQQRERRAYQQPRPRAALEKGEKKMCNQWEMKTLACGHIVPDGEVVICAAFAFMKDIKIEPACDVVHHSSPSVRPYLGPSELDPNKEERESCEECEGRKATEEQWKRANGVPVDQSRHTGYLTSRRFLMSLDFVQWEDVRAVQDQIIRAWVDRGEVVDVSTALRDLGYDMPKLEPEGKREWVDIEEEDGDARAREMWDKWEKWDRDEREREMTKVIDEDFIDDILCLE
ncbi:hypothetical protein AAE478_007889 [Parahypoxylon ruwenzoriense]